VRLQSLQDIEALGALYHTHLGCLLATAARPVRRFCERPAQQGSWLLAWHHLLLHALLLLLHALLLQLCPES
jgi:hypothetical protein